MPRASVAERDVICLSSIDWDFIWQGHQEIMSRLAASGHRVLFVENTGVRPVRWSDMPRLKQRLRNWRRGTKGFREERPNLFVQSPLVLPFPYFNLARRINRWMLKRSITRWMTAVGASRPVVWTFLPTPLARDVIASLDPALTIYYCIDDLASSSPEARKIAPSEQELFKSADLVFTTSEKLRARAAQFSDRVHLFPFAVNMATFEKVRDAATPAPDDIAKLPRPIAGYVGGLHQWVDQDLLAAVAERMPDVTFALVGPPQVDVSRLERVKNIQLFGQRPHAELPGYVKNFDVGLVPYRISEYTANVYPTKLNEYLIMGIPVVATDLFEIRRFNGEHGDLIRIASSVDDYVKAIRAAMEKSPAPVVARRIEVAQSNSWDRRLDAMSALIEKASADKASSTAGWEARLRAIYDVARRRALQIIVPIALALLLVFYTPLAWWIAEPLRVSSPPQAADAIVVFAGGVGESGKAGVGVPERVGKAVELYRAGYAPSIVFSSGYVFTLREAETMKAIATSLGVPADAIVLEETAANTYQNVRNTSQIAHARGWSRVLLVSSPYHMLRATRTWHKVAPGITVTPTPPSESEFYLHERGASLDQIRGIAHEYVAIVVYWLRGWA
ncbi:MAG TPA: ElyC/SanA/YdcF family protein [Vicinamibacterales bacterium]|nr:ElyC/SanA/YdcF family protein [Vicinamibacterales bacterium]